MVGGVGYLGRGLLWSWVVVGVSSRGCGCWRRLSWLEGSRQLWLYRGGRCIVVGRGSWNRNVVAVGRVGVAAALGES